MSRLDELIKELCPNGVEYKKMGELGIFENIGVDKKINNNEKEVLLLNYTDVYKNNYIDKSIPKMIVTANDKKIENCSVEEWDIFITPTSETKEDIGHASVILETIPDCCYSYHIMRYRLNNPNRITASFIMYLFFTQDLKKQILKYAQGLTRYGLSKEKFLNLLVPIPPLEVQEEIVKILDNYTKSVEELKEKLNDEQIARKKQYSWYRDYLLKFENKVEKFKLSEITTIKARIGWQGLTKEEYLNTGDYYLITGTDFQNGEINLKTCYYVNEERYTQDKNIQLKNDDVLVTKDGTLGKVAYVKNLDKPATLNSGIFVIRSIDNLKLLNRYLFHYLKAPYLMNYAQNKLTGGTIKHLNQNVIVDFEIPLPPLDVQKRIVEVLDNFEKICNNLNIGLPAEIEAREKQYEFFRNYLLTFEEKSRQAILACELASLRACVASSKPKI